MKLAWRELIRSPGRFVSAGASLTLLVVLLLVLGGILDALIGSSTGFLRAQSAPLIVYSAESEDSILRSRIDAPTREAVASVPGVASAHGIGVALLAGHVPDRPEPANVALFGYEAPNERVPAPPPPGSGLADRSLEGEGVAIGTVIELGAARVPVEVAGWVEDTGFNQQGGLWVDGTTWRRALNENIPDAAIEAGTVPALVVTPASGVEPAALAASIEGEVTGVRALTIEQAIAGIPGVAQQQSVFTSIIGTTFVVAGIVVALFFALLTIERVGLLGMLKAIGASTRTLATGLTIQAMLIAGGALVVGCLLTLGLAAVIPDTVPLRLGAGRFASTAAGLVLTAVAGSAISFRRIIRIDPASAVGGA
jgi:putative ABC transport system permease protein